MTTIAKKVSKQRTLQGIDTLTYTVDAQGRTLGRVASDAAQGLLGKRSAHYVQNKVLPVEVTIINSDKLFMTEKRENKTTFRRYTGYPGGLREETLAEMKTKKGIQEVIRKAVDGMLPRNKLRNERMKRLIIK